MYVSLECLEFVNYDVRHFVVMTMFDVTVLTVATLALEAAYVVAWRGLSVHL